MILFSCIANRMQISGKPLYEKKPTFRITNCAFMQRIFINPFIQRQHNVIGTVVCVNRSILFNPNEMDTNAD